MAGCGCQGNQGAIANPAVYSPYGVRPMGIVDTIKANPLILVAVLAVVGAGAYYLHKEKVI